MITGVGRFDGDELLGGGEGFSKTCLPATGLQHEGVAVGGWQQPSVTPRIDESINIGSSRRSRTYGP